MTTREEYAGDNYTTTLDNIVIKGGGVNPNGWGLYDAKSGEMIPNVESFTLNVNIYDPVVKLDVKYVFSPESITLDLSEGHRCHDYFCGTHEQV